ncbi:hypothetical protein ILYODFUR_037396 [Ilyodon furcidens]|uniref:Uncharacterized protein n=1 Tax=Ilyodon furcidens TaxID=33524 RepID=A0ABV0TQ31_9TELE
MSAVVQSSFLHLGQLAKVKPHLPADVSEHIIHFFVTCRLDYYNSLYFGTVLYSPAPVSTKSCSSFTDWYEKKLAHYPSAGFPSLASCLLSFNVSLLTSLTILLVKPFDS